MTNFSRFSQGEVSEKQVIRSRVAKTQEPVAERLRGPEHSIFLVQIIINV